MSTETTGETVKFADFHKSCVFKRHPLLPTNNILPFSMMIPLGYFLHLF